MTNSGILHDLSSKPTSCHGRERAAPADTRAACVPHFKRAIAAGAITLFAFQLLARLAAAGAGEADVVPGFARRPGASTTTTTTCPRAPEPTHLQDLDTTLLMRDSLANEVDRVLSLEGGRPALDVNALDEVPCSTWFCARNHLAP